MANRNKKAIQEVAISKFKAECLALLQEVGKTRTPIRVTRRGKPIADVVPIPTASDERSWLGCLEGTVKILGDVISPVIDVETIEAMKD